MGTKILYSPSDIEAQVLYFAWMKTNNIDFVRGNVIINYK